MSDFGFGNIPPFYVRGTLGASIAALPAAGSAALTDKIVNITAGGVVQTETPAQLFTLLGANSPAWTGGPWTWTRVPVGNTAASTEDTAFKVVAFTETWAAGALTTQRTNVFEAQTIAFASASTVTNAATVAITAAPIAGTFATLTNTWALWVQAGITRLDGPLVVTGDAVGTSALTDKLYGATSTNVGSSFTPASILALFDDQAITWTAAQAWTALGSIVGAGTPAAGTTKGLEVAATTTGTSASRYGFISTMAATPGSTSTATIVGIVGAATQTAQNNTGASGLQAFRAQVSNTGAGAITAATTYCALPMVNSGGGSIATAIQFKAEALAVGTTRWAFWAESDPSFFGGNVLLGTAVAGASAAGGVLAMGNGATAPTNSADLAQLYAVDLSAGNCTLGIRTETAVAVDVALASTNSLTVKINGTNYRILLAA